MSEVDLAPQTATWLRELAARRGRSEAQVLADLIEAEVAREAAPRPADLAERETGGTGREIAHAGEWRVVLVPQAAAEFDGFPPGLRRRIEELAGSLAVDPSQGKESGTRRRTGFRFAGGEWRLVYTVTPATRSVSVLVVTTREHAVY